MKIALLSDIHGNLPALEAVRADLPAVDRVVCAGDIVGYNPWPSDCTEVVREIADVTVIGNHDRTVTTPSEYRANPMAEAGLEYAKADLSAAQLEWLQSRPRKATVADDRFLLVHDHPTDRDRYVYPDAFPSVRPHLDDFDGAVLGHTHVQHEATVDDRLIVNPGSVGQPRDGDNRAAYALLALEDDGWSLERRRVDYDIDRVIARIEETEIPTEAGTRLLAGE